MKRDEPRDPNSPTSLSSLCSSLTLKQLYLVQSLFSHLQQPFDTQVKWLTDCYPICYMYGVLWLYTCTVWPPSPHLPFLQTGPGPGGTQAVVAWSGPGTIHQVWWAAASHSVVWWSPHSTHVTYTCCNMSHIHQWCFTIGNTTSERSLQWISVTLSPKYQSPTSASWSAGCDLIWLRTGSTHCPDVLAVSSG